MQLIISHSGETHRSSSLRKGALFILHQMEKKKVIVYVDGYNFYYGLKNGKEKWRRVYWLDVVKFFEKMMQPDQELVEVHYYSARPLNDQQAYDNQDDFFCANQQNPKLMLMARKREWLKKR